MSIQSVYFILSHVSVYQITCKIKSMDDVCYVLSGSKELYNTTIFPACNFLKYFKPASNRSYSLQLHLLPKSNEKLDFWFAKD